MATIHEALMLAVEHHECGRMAEAETLYRRILDADPSHANAHHLLGVLEAQRGRFDAAAAAVGTAIGLNGAVAGFHVTLAQIAQALGRWEAAADAFDTAAVLDPGVATHAERAAEARARLAAGPDGAARLLAWADARLDRGEAGRAAAGYAVAVGLDPASPLAWHNRGVALRELGRVAEAAAAFRRAARLAPAVPAICRNLAHAQQAVGDAGAARRTLRHLLRLDPADAETLDSLAGFGGDAVLLRRTLRTDPGRGQRLVDLAALRFAARRPAEAATALYRALALDPAAPGAWTSLGSVRQETGDAWSAVALHERALRIDPDGLAGFVHGNLGVALMGCGRLDAAIAALRHAADTAPQNPERLSNLLFCLCFSEATPAAAVFAEHRRYGDRHSRPLPAASVWAMPRDPERPLRVGYLSPDFMRYPGPAFHYLLPLFEHHDKARFQVFGYHASAATDPVTQEFKARATGWCDASGLDDDALAGRIRADSLDILVDCAGHMALNRLPVFARKPAPVQIGYPLYPNTGGLPAIDYRIVDPCFAPPGADALNTEALIRLPHTHVVYRPAPSACRPAERTPAATAGVFTFASFNNLAKLSPATVAAWAAILRDAPGSRLMLKWRGLGSTGGGPLGARIADAFRAAGVTPDRLVMRGPTPDPYEAYAAVDLCLDPLYANGGTTTCDALWMGVPVLTLCGEAPFSRVGLLHLTNAGLPELIARSAAEYHALALRAVRDRAWLEACRAGLSARFAASPAMDAPLYVRHLESAYRTVWRRWCAGEPATALTL